MSGQVYWVLELEIHPGRETEGHAVMAEMVQATRESEPGTLHYEWSFGSDARTCHTYERYADSAAVMTHLGNFGARFAGRFLEVFKPVRFTVYGEPSAEVREALAGFSPVFLKPAAGFTRGQEAGPVSR